MPEFGIQRKWKAFEELRRRIRTLETRRRAVESSPADPRARLRLGDAFRALGRLDDALGQYREAASLFEKQGFRRHAHAARILILRIRPDDAGALRDLRFTSNLDLARSQVPLMRELRALPPREGFGPLLALPESIAERTHHPRTEEERLAGERAGKVTGRERNGVRRFEIPVDDEPPSPSRPPPPRALTTEGVVVAVEVEEPPPPIVRGRPRPKDRRADPRVAAEGEARIFRGADALGRIEDVSESGIFVAGPRFEPGTVLDVVLRTPELDWLGLARVRVARSAAASRRQNAGIGLEFLWADTPTERWIEQFVARSYGTELGGADASEAARRMADDRRRVYPRRPVSLPIALAAPDFEVAGWAMDVSLGGAFVQAPRVFSAGRRVEAILWLPGAGVPLRIASVVANARDSGTGIRFIRLTEPQEELLARVL